MLKCIIGESYKMKQILKVLYVHYKSIYWLALEKYHQSAIGNLKTLMHKRSQLSH
jgi:hypothetical protein